MAAFRRTDFDKRVRRLVIDDDAVHRMIICKMALKAGLATLSSKRPRPRGRMRGG